MMTNHYFVTGTDTEIGKTFVSCILLELLKQQGLRSVGYKPLAAGASRMNNIWVNEDAQKLQQASSPGFGISEINPVCLQNPIAPHLAARIEGVTIDPARMLSGYRHLAGKTQAMIVEGVGGFRVPVTDTYDMADFAGELGLPVILVVGLRLGCISHALLTAESILARNLTLHGWIGNILAPDMSGLEGNIHALKQRLPVPCLGIVPFMPDGKPASATQYLDLNQE